MPLMVAAFHDGVGVVGTLMTIGALTNGANFNMKDKVLIAIR